MIKDATMFLEEIESNFDIDSLTGEDFEEIMCTYLSSCYDYAYGASKGVMFTIGEYDEVIKLPLFYSDKYDFDHDLRLSTNYCDIEYENYIKAQEYGVAQYFAALRLLGSVQGYSIYAQEYCEIVDEYDISEEDSFEKAFSIYTESQSSTGLPKEWAAEFIERYGESELLKLYDFIKDVGINDLHDSNVGRRQDGSLVIIDYSGFEG